MEPLASIEGAGLACVRGGRLVFRGLDLRAEAGQVLTLEGPNGAGKSSLLRMLAGFLAPEAGDIAFETRDGAVRDAEERGRLVGWLGHEDAIKPQLTPRETLGFFAALHGAAGFAAGLLESVGLNRVADLPCRYLSAGQKRRLALARLTLAARPLWLLDEPLAALDAQGKSLLRAMIATHCAAGGIVLAATHDPLGVDASRLVLGAP
ncbi:MAG: heme ABC exporter ATP-binding protein CcmA [Rhizomicrobium sp.]